MIEIDENGKEWFGYTVGGGELDDPASVIEAFTGNMHYVEWFFRKQEGSKQRTLATQLGIFFDHLPSACVARITDDRENLIRELVRLRNRYAHGRYDEEMPSLDRLQALSIKVAVLITFVDISYKGRHRDAIRMADTMSPYLKEKLAQTDRLTAVATP